MVYQFVTTDKELSQVCLELEPCEIIGVDLEADSMHCFSEKICLIQIAGPNQAALQAIVGPLGRIEKIQIVLQIQTCVRLKQENEKRISQRRGRIS